MDSLNRFARAYGDYRLVVQNAANDRNGRPTRYHLYCDHGDMGGGARAAAQEQR